MVTIKSVIAVALAMPLAIFAVVDTHAEPADGASVDPLVEVVVTATKKKTALMTTPVAVSAFSQELLNRLRIYCVLATGA